MRASSSSSFATPKWWTHDVFLSFGEDTRHSFTDHLYSNLVQKGIYTFRDDELPRGEEMSQAVVLAIEGSKFSLIVFSENYASSKWCLDELAHIVESNRSNQQTVWPVFYKVDPSDVRHQRGSFGDAFANHERNFIDNMDKVLRWRRALTEAANLCGWCFSDSDGYESKFIHDVVEDISLRVKQHTYLNVANYPVGLESRVEHVLEHLDVGGSDIRKVGIWGVGGIGKTTIAKAVYNSIAHKFDCSCFLANVREKSLKHNGLLHLQNELLCEILGDRELKVNNVHMGTSLLRERLSRKKILLVLDDVTESRQIETLVGASDWFGSGSRIIITSRDKHLLIFHEINPIYKVRELDLHEAGELFILNAFKDKTNLDDDEKILVSSIVEHAHGLPLALEVLGASLYHTSLHKGQAILDSFIRSPHPDIIKILRISYTELETEVRDVFLDIACFFNGQKVNKVIQILEGCGRINPGHCIEVLEEKSLINVVDCDYIWMHNLLEEMGKEIVHQESPNSPGERSRLWYHKDVVEVLTKNTETNETLDIKIEKPEPNEISSTAKSISQASSTEWTFLCIAFCLEIMSLCFDQLSSPRKPIYALFGMLLAIAALLNCICELIHKGIKERVVLRRRGMLWRFHYPGSHYVSFGTLPDFYGLVGGIFQCICSTIQYVYFIRHDKNPIKVSLLPTIFVICLAVSRVNWNQRDEPIQQND